MHGKVNSHAHASPVREQHPRLDPEEEDDRVCVLLMRTWSDGEAELVRQILSVYGIPCQVVSDVPHAIFPLCVDGLGEVRIRVLASQLGEAEAILAEHRREGLEILDGGIDSEDGCDSVGPTSANPLGAAEREGS